VNAVLVSSKAWMIFWLCRGSALSLPSPREKGKDKILDHGAARKPWEEVSKRMGWENHIFN